MSQAVRHHVESSCCEILQWLLLLLLCVASDLAQPAAQAMASPPSAGGDQTGAAARALVREVLEREAVAEALGLRRGDDVVGDVCSVACQTCLTVCAVSCVLNKEPVSCFVNCTVTSTCFGKPVAA